MKPQTFLFTILLLSLSLHGQNKTIAFSNPIHGHTGRINEVAFIQNAEELISVSDDKSMCFWNTKNDHIFSKKFFKFDSYKKGAINCFCASSDGNLIYFGGYTMNTSNKFGVFQYNRKSEEIIQITQHNKPITKIKLNSAGTLLASGSKDSTIQICALTNGDVKFNHSFSLPNVISDISFSYNDDMLSIATRSNSIYFIDLKTQKISSIEKHYLSARVVEFSPDSSYLVSGGNDYLINLYTSKGKFIKKLHKSVGAISDVSFSADGKYLLVATDGRGAIDCISVPSGKLINRYTDFNNTVTSVNFSPESINGNYDVIAAGGTHHELKIFNAMTGKTVKHLGQNGKCIQNLEFRDDDKIVFNFDKEDKFAKYMLDFNNMVMSRLVAEKLEVQTNELQKYFRNLYAIKVNGKIFENSKEVDGRVLSVLKYDQNNILEGNDFSFKNINLETAQAQTLKAHKGSVRAIAKSKTGKWIASASEDQIIHLWKLNNNILDTIPFMSIFVTELGEWICWTKEGYFTGSQKSDTYLAWENNDSIDDWAKITDASTFSEILYRPDLLITSFRNGKEIKNVLIDNKENFVDITKLERASPPEFKDPFVNSASRDIRRSLDKQSTDIYIVDTTEAVLSVLVKYGGGGIAELNLYQNDKLIAIDKNFALQNVRDKVIKEYPVRLLPGKNQFKVNTINNQKIKSASDQITLECKSTMTPISDLHILTIGINEYENQQMNLNYGTPDAKAVNALLQEKTKNIFGKVYSYALYDKEATLKNIKNTIEIIKTQSKLSDVFILYYAGHGVVYTPDNSDEGEFYMVLNGVTSLKSSSVKENGLSSTMLRKWLSEINASKQLVLMDACHSEASFKGIARRGLAEQQAMYQLARSSGTVIIAACGSDQSAKEFKDLGHGAFTYALLEALNGKADGGTMDKKITVNELKAYIEDRVPQLTQKYGGTAQYPTGYSIGQDFPVTIVK